MLNKIPTVENLRLIEVDAPVKNQRVGCVTEQERIAGPQIKEEILPAYK